MFVHLQDETVRFALLPRERGIFVSNEHSRKHWPVISVIVIDEDDAIDYSDIPATDEAFWDGAIVHRPE